ncbi:hypothetical protein [Pseudogulbenkiania sp. MAI-1]|uniref:hypothetical protein n=1 Tax=Pseudogulbenkiania sp. MAI-1 TaxID=990370 RepID=UPI0012EB9007|nr:hypothetical protein [Pseudogulbenkiania sp. MAI-1]
MIIAKELENNKLQVRYRFCDGLILCAFAAGYLSYRSKVKNQSAINSFMQYQDPRKIGGMINLSKSCFLEFTSLENLMNFAGLGLYGDGPRWNLQRAVARFYRLSNKVDRKLSVENWKSIIHNELDGMLLWNGLAH